MAKRRTITLHFEDGPWQLDYPVSDDGTLELGRAIAFQAAYRHGQRILGELRLQGLKGATRVKFTRARFVRERVAQVNRQMGLN